MPPDPPSRSTATRRDKVTDRLPPPAAPGSSQARSGGITSILPRHIYTYVPTMYVACVEAMRGTRLGVWLPGCLSGEKRVVVCTMYVVIWGTQILKPTSQGQFTHLCPESAMGLAGRGRRGSLSPASPALLSGYFSFFCD